MYLRENPVLQREMLINLRMKRAFITLAAFILLLGAMVYAAWPAYEDVDMINPVASKRLVDLFFLGQYILTSLMAPTFAAGAITGEKERKSYEMLLASPLRPTAIVVGKLLSSLAHLGLLIFSSLPIVMLCLPLGGVNFYEVLAVYLSIILVTTTFGLISLWCSSFFSRTASSLVVSYLIILPLALVGLLMWNALEGGAVAGVRLLIAAVLLPVICGLAWVGLITTISARLLHPPDVGSEGKEVIDEEREQDKAVGLVIRRDQFPDKLFAPPKRTGLLPDGANPVYDKEMRSEIFSQGTLMLRVVIQVSMFLAIPIMAWCLYLRPELAAWYVGYVILFNLMVGPVFSAGSVTSERERETLDLLLTTLITPLQILVGKLISGLRVSSVLTMFLLWPLVLACVMVGDLRSHFLTMLAYVAIVLMTCLTTANIALFTSVISKKSSFALIFSYVAIGTLFIAPLGVERFVETFFPEQEITFQVKQQAYLSPISAAFALPLDVKGRGDDVGRGLSQEREASSRYGWRQFGLFSLVYSLLNLSLVGVMAWLFSTRWRVAY